MTGKRLLDLEEAASLTPFSVAHLRRCIRIAQPTPQMPALKAKKDGRGRYLIRPADLEDWIDRMEDA